MVEVVENDDSLLSQLFWSIYREEWREYCKIKFRFLDSYKKIYGREPLPKWSGADVQEFIDSDLVYGPQI